MKPIREKGKYVRDNKGGIVEEKDWEAELTLDDLRLITDKFIDMLVNQRLES